MKNQTSALLAGIGIGIVVAALTITEKRQEEEHTPQDLAADSRATEALLAEAVQAGDTSTLTAALRRILSMAKEDPRRLVEFAFGA